MFDLFYKFHTLGRNWCVNIMHMLYMYSLYTLQHAQSILPLPRNPSPLPDLASQQHEPVHSITPSECRPTAHLQTKGREKAGPIKPRMTVCSRRINVSAKKQSPLLIGRKQVLGVWQCRADPTTSTISLCSREA